MDSLRELFPAVDSEALLAVYESTGRNVEAAVEILLSSASTPRSEGLILLDSAATPILEPPPIVQRAEHDAFMTRHLVSPSRSDASVLLPRSAWWRAIQQEPENRDVSEKKAANQKI